MSRGCRPAPGAAAAAAAAATRPGALGPPLVRRPGPPCAAAGPPPVRRPGSAPPPARGSPARRAPARGSAGAPGSSAGRERPPGPARAGDRAQVLGGRETLEVWAGRPRREAPARRGLCAPPSTAPSPGAARSAARESRSPLPPPRSLPRGDSAAGGSRVALPGEPRQRQDPGRGAVPPGWRGAAAAPPDRAKLPPGCRQTGPAFPRLPLRITAGGCRRESTPQCRPGGGGSPAAGTAGRGRLQPRPPARAAVGSPRSPPLQPPPHRKKQ